MHHDIHGSEPLGSSTVLALCCLAVLVMSYVAIGFGLSRLATVELPAAVRAYVAGV